MLDVIQLPILDDNYVYLIHDPVSEETVVVDPGVAQPVLTALKQYGWQLTYIFNTHHHWDHVGGNLEIKANTGCLVIAGIGDAARIPGFDQGVQGGDILWLGQHPIHVLSTPGHTLHHVAYYLAEDKKLFCGDTLFVMGCGRLFEGSAQQLWQSLQQFKKLPVETEVYCTHEYTLTNGRFALAVEPDNVDLQQKMAWVRMMRADLKPTVPSTIAQELATNPFFREDSVRLKKIFHKNSLTPVEIFAELRQMKDSFN